MLELIKFQRLVHITNLRQSLCKSIVSGGANSC